MLFPMREGVAREWEIFTLALALGLALGVVYAVLSGLVRLLRRRLACDILDFLSAMCFAFCYFVFSVAQTGELRFFTLLAMLLGAGTVSFLSHLLFRRK